MHQSILLLSALAGLSLAQDTTSPIEELPFLLPIEGFEAFDLAADVSIPNPSTTIAHIICPTDGPDCGVGLGGHGIDYTILSNTKYIGTSIDPGLFTMTWSCVHNARQTKVACAESYGGPDANFPGETTSVFEGTAVASLFMGFVTNVAMATGTATGEGVQALAATRKLHQIHDGHETSATSTSSHKSSPTPTIPFYYPGGADYAPLVASISVPNPQTTIARVACAPDVDSSDCGWANGADYTILSSTIYKGTLSMPGDGEDGGPTLTWSGDHDTKKKEMVWTMAFFGGTDEPRTTTWTDVSSDIIRLVATVTKGAEALETGKQTAGSGVSGASGTVSGKGPAETGAAGRVGGGGVAALVALAGAVVLNAW